MIFESHAHYDDEAFNEDRDELIAHMKKGGIGQIVNVCSDLSSLTTTIDLAEKYPFIYAAVGIHPSDSGELDEASFEKVRQASFHRKAVAIGEIGLDYHWPEPDHETQKKWFVRQLLLSKERNLPVIIHSREAAKDTLDLMKEHHAGSTGGIIHCYSYSKETARDFLDMGYSFGIGGVVTFPNAKKLKEAVEYIPLERIVVETDCPYMAPVPHRGKRNSSLNLPHIIEAIAEIKKTDTKTVEDQTASNAKRIFRLEENEYGQSGESHEYH